MNKIIARALSRTRRHALTHAQVCTHIRALAHANTRLYTHAPMRANPRTRQRMLAHTRTPACIPPHEPTRVCTYLHIHSHMHEPTRTHPCVGFFIA